jgi:hypothetical protein
MALFVIERNFVDQLDADVIVAVDQLGPLGPPETSLSSIRTQT